MYRRTVVLMAAFVSPLLAVDARADLLLAEDGVELHGTVQLWLSGATTCNVRESDTAYESRKANHGAPIDVWRVDAEVRNRTGRWLDRMAASYFTESRWPECSGWGHPEGLSLTEMYHFSSDVTNISDSGYPDVAPGAVLTAETEYFIVLRGDPPPRFHMMSLSFNFVAGGDSGSDPEAVEESLGLDRTTRRQLQRGLQAAGFSPGAADGLFGPRTRAAIRSWQRSRSERPTGYLDAASAAALQPVGSASAGQPPGATSRADLEFWQSIADSTNPLMFEAYLARFPNGAFRALAQNRLAVLGRSAAAAPASARAEPAPRDETPSRTEARRSRQPVRRPALRSRPAGQRSGATSRADLAFWQSIANSTSPSVFEAYLSQFPNGAFRALAQNRLAVLGRSAPAPRASARAEPVPRAAAPRRTEARGSREGRPSAGGGGSARTSFNAVAVGGRPKSGLVTGFALNEPSADAARRVAVEKCRDYYDGEPMEWECSVVTMFDRCAVVSIDMVFEVQGYDRDGFYYGIFPSRIFGWATGPDLDTLRPAATEDCRSKGGAECDDRSMASACAR